MDPAALRSSAVLFEVEVVSVDVEYELARAARDVAAVSCPGAPALVARAVVVALCSFAAGASLPEALERARALSRSWADHPSVDHKRADLPVLHP